MNCSSSKCLISDKDVDFFLYPGYELITYLLKTLNNKILPLQERLSDKKCAAPHSHLGNGECNNT